MHRFTFALTGLGLAALLGLAGCEQDIGERCQVNTDCSTNVCNTSTKTCQLDNTSVDDGDAGIDAPLDAAVIDAAIIDAAGLDAAPDAAL